MFRKHDFCRSAASGAKITRNTNDMTISAFFIMYHYFYFFPVKRLKIMCSYRSKVIWVIFQSYVNVLITKKLLSNQAAFCLILNLLWNLLPSHEIQDHINYPWNDCITTKICWTTVTGVWMFIPLFFSLLEYEIHPCIFWIDFVALP